MIKDASLIIPINENKILLQLRDEYASNRPNMWAFFGGAIEKTETPLDAAIRELYEELSITSNLHYFRNIERKKYHGTFKKHIFTFKTKKPETYFRSRLKEGQDVDYFSINDINNEFLMKQIDKEIAYTVFNTL